MTQNGYQVFRPTQAQRFWRALGFALVPSCPPVELRLGYAPGSISVITHVRLSPGDRLRLLLTGHLGIGLSIQTDVEVRAAHTTARAEPMAPFGA